MTTATKNHIKEFLFFFIRLIEILTPYFIGFVVGFISGEVYTNVTNSLAGNRFHDYREKHNYYRQ